MIVALSVTSAGLILTWPRLPSHSLAGTWNRVDDGPEDRGVLEISSGGSFSLTVSRLPNTSMRAKGSFTQANGQIEFSGTSTMSEDINGVRTEARMPFKATGRIVDGRLHLRKNEYEEWFIKGNS